MLNPRYSREIEDELRRIGAQSIHTYSNGYDFVIGDGKGWKRRIKLLVNGDGTWVAYWGRDYRETKTHADWRVLLSRLNQPNLPDETRLDASEGVDRAWEE